MWSLFWTRRYCSKQPSELQHHLSRVPHNLPIIQSESPQKTCEVWNQPLGKLLVCARAAGVCWSVEERYVNVNLPLASDQSLCYCSQFMLTQKPCLWSPSGGGIARWICVFLSQNFPGVSRSSGRCGKPGWLSSGTVSAWCINCKFIKSSLLNCGYKLFMSLISWFDLVCGDQRWNPDQTFEFTFFCSIGLNCLGLVGGGGTVGHTHINNITPGLCRKRAIWNFVVQRSIQSESLFVFVAL